MKTLIRAVFTFTALIAFAAAPSQLTINGKVLGNIVVLQGGVWAVPLDQFAKALGAPITLEPLLSLQGNRLVAKNSSASVAYGKVNVEYKPQKADGSLDAGVHFKYDIKAQKEAMRVAAGQSLEVLRPGEISSGVVMMGGKAYVPVRDVVRAFGDGSVRGTFSGALAPGQNVNVNIAHNPNGIIAILIGL